MFSIICALLLFIQSYIQYVCYYLNANTRETFCSASLYCLIHTFCTHTIYTYITHKCEREVLRENPS